MRSPSIDFWMVETICMKLGMYIIASEPISTAYIMTPPVSLCPYVYPLIDAMQRLAKNSPVITSFIIKFFQTWSVFLFNIS
jgi:hypothetical protein